jgi:hypothetical protein
VALPNKVPMAKPAAPAMIASSLPARAGELKVVALTTSANAARMLVILRIGRLHYKPD